MVESVKMCAFHLITLWCFYFITLSSFKQ